jgi:hypothetical protein
MSLVENIMNDNKTCLHKSAKQKIIIIKKYYLNVKIKDEIDPLLALVLPYLDRALFTFSNYLMLYYIVFGLAISMFFG